MLTDFRNKVCGALLFINILFLVFTIVLKVKSEDMNKLELPVPVSILSFGEADTVKEWQLDQLPTSANRTEINRRYETAGEDTGVVRQWIQGLGTELPVLELLAGNHLLPSYLS